MRSNTTKFLLTVALLATVGSIAATGLILGWGIPRGYGHHCEHLFLGLPRHDWIDIHIYFAVVCFTLLLLHLWTNLQWILVTTKRYFRAHWKSGIAFLLWSWILLLISAWVFAILGACGMPSMERSPLEMLLGW